MSDDIDDIKEEARAFGFLLTHGLAPGKYTLIPDAFLETGLANPDLDRSKAVEYDSLDAVKTYLVDLAIG